MATTLATAPAWVIDHNTFKLWEQGMDESMMPKDVLFTSETAAQVRRMLEWAESTVASLKTQEEAEATQRLGGAQPVVA